MVDSSQSLPQGALNRESPLPLYYQLKQSILNDIRSGVIEPGEPLPTEKDLEEIYDVSRITVRRALSDLVSEGYIYRQSGRGTFVLPQKVEHRRGGLSGVREDLALQGFHTSSEILINEMRPVPEHIAEKLHNVKKGDHLLYVERILKVDGSPWAITRGHHNFGVNISFTTEELAEDSIFSILNKKYHIELKRVERIIEAALPTLEETELLNISESTPVLVTHLLVSNDRKQYVSYMHNVYRGDRYKYHHTIE